MGVSIDQLRRGAKSYQCGEYLSRCEEIHRQNIYTSLEHERLTRKSKDIVGIFNGDGYSSWSQVFYLLFMRTLGDEINREVFMELAKRVPMKFLLRERNSPLRVEAMLVGASGLMERYHNEEYIQPMKREAKYLLHKYQITPLSISHWNLGRIRPTNHPIVRLSQVAMLLCSHETLFDSMLACESCRDVDNLFSVRATTHLIDTHPHLMREGQEEISIGAMKRSLLGINLVVPLQFAYGDYTNDDELRYRAQDLNESLPAEANRYIRKWRDRGLNPCSAFETQALIQLTTCYCRNSQCEACPVGRRIIKGVI